MKLIFLIILIIACFAVGPGIVLMALVYIPMMLAEWLFHLAGSPQDKYVVWIIIGASFAICLFPFFYKKGM